MRKLRISLLVGFFAVAVGLLLLLYDGIRGMYLREKLGKAATYGDLVSVKQLLLDGVDPNNGYEGDITPLNMAAQEDYPEIAKCLLEHGADPRREMEDGTTPLDAASGTSKKLLADWIKNHAK